MGTNYYVKLDKPRKCECCGSKLAGYEKLHIGKSSFGWFFSLAVHKELELDTTMRWLHYLTQPGVEIEDEYGVKVTPEFLISRMVQRTSGIPKKEEGLISVAYSSTHSLYYPTHYGCHVDTNLPIVLCDYEFS